MKNMLRGFGSATLLALLLASAPAVAQNQAKVGTLSCDVSAGIGLIIVQKQSMSCTFTPDRGGVVSHYTGQIVEYGVALGAVERGQLVWGVIAATAGIPSGALAGTYAGVGVEATAGLGLGANVLVGGTGRAFSLQPLSVEGQVGVNVAGGITTLTLASAP